MIINEYEYLFEKTHQDGGGKLDIKVKSRAAKLAWMKHAKFDRRFDDPQDAVDWLDGPEDTFEVITPKNNNHTENYRAFFCIAELPAEYCAPYLDFFETVTGERSIPHMDLMPYEPWFGWRYTHYMQSCAWVDGTKLLVTMYIAAQDWCGYVAQARSMRRSAEVMLDTHAYSVPIPEFIQCGNGSMVPNPKYATGYKEHRPAIESEWMLKPLVFEWLDCEEHSKKSAAVARHIQVYEKSRIKPVLFTDRWESDRGLRVAWDGGNQIIPWADFRSDNFELPPLKDNTICS